MLNQILFYAGGTITLGWGIAHLFPTKSIVKGFGEISIDNKHIITMEWIIEGVALIYIGVIVVGVTMIEPTNNVSVFIYLSSVLVLVFLAVISSFTGFKVNILPFKLCPFLFSFSAILILLGYTL
ncbi:MAG: hypothetical protein A2315_06555 [Ignavibacteria bacterium RIFOXYB2_FULL_35_12]|nr:MAG: hypothetical protein A2058_01775 [Ignavibacteria bacterium GWA2_36_19]OGU58795.1 MAG: hypothetical protein A2X60_11305 [Ignavibacteria bacterium GWF2_35_20]OGU78154.1 MAG: hypothetical protein A2254_10085 [Ignavibacteria bacterium RIFOXYA2_FULL_35_9]OGU91343.1 MAG: hypothetical protein A3K31_08305 [Ignavibacteria bacterium RIFOXYA12_FULL_35_25]OGU94421.1 MAG: hypothetical protein A2347_13530 [Ignavibacteria bacterium RIFOXYB12_FULL_35_14]OGU98395.1 MAG: hypothetical protein A2455_01235